MHRFPSRPACALALLCPFFSVAALEAQIVAAPYDKVYSAHTLGSPAQLPTNFGGVTFRVSDPNALYISGAAASTSAAVYRVPVVRDAQKHITGFAGPAVKVADTPNADGGLQFGPGGVLFFTRYRTHALGMVKASSTQMDKSVTLLRDGFRASVGSLTFVPAGYPKAGSLKLVSYNSGMVATATLRADAQGTYDVASLTVGTSVTGGPEGMFYVQPGSPLIPDFSSMMICEWRTGAVALYAIDANGDPIAATRKPFLTSLTGAEGAAIDPVTGDFVFSTYGGGNRVVAIRGFAVPCGATELYGQGLAGSGNKVPAIDHEGCFARRQRVEITTDGLASAPGAMIVGLQSVSAPVFGGTLLVAPLFLVPHVQDTMGKYAMAVDIPDDTNLLNTDFFFQSVYFDRGATQGISFTRGLKLRVR